MQTLNCSLPGPSWVMLALLLIRLGLTPLCRALSEVVWASFSLHHPSSAIYYHSDVSFLIDACSFHLSILSPAYFYNHALCRTMWHASSEDNDHCKAMADQKLCNDVSCFYRVIPGPAALWARVFWAFLCLGLATGFLLHFNHGSASTSVRVFRGLLRLSIASWLDRVAYETQSNYSAGSFNSAAWSQIM